MLAECLPPRNGTCAPPPPSLWWHYRPRGTSQGWHFTWVKQVLPSPVG